MCDSRSIAAALALTLALAAAGDAPLRAEEAAATKGHPMIGEAAPTFDLDSVAHGRIGLESFRGQYLVIHFGASW